MGLPQLPDDISPDIDLDAEQVSLLLLLSIALEEISLAAMINVEAEKLQAAVGSPLTPGGDVNEDLVADDLDELLDANRSAERMLRTIIKKEMLLQFKTEDVLDFLAGVTTTTPVNGDACGCSLTPAFDVILTAPANTITPPILPVGVTVVNDTSLRIAADICDDCTAGDNNFFYNFNRPATTGGGPPTPPFSQIFSATTFETTQCILNPVSGTEVALSVSGRGNAIGTGTGSVTGLNRRYTAIFDELANTVTLIIFDAATGLIPVYTQTQALPVTDLVVAPCTTTI